MQTGLNLFGALKITLRWTSSFRECLNGLSSSTIVSNTCNGDYSSGKELAPGKSEFIPLRGHKNGFHLNDISHAYLRSGATHMTVHITPCIYLIVSITTKFIFYHIFEVLIILLPYPSSSPSFIYLIFLAPIRISLYQHIFFHFMLMYFYLVHVIDEL